MASIKQRPDGTYRARYRGPDGKEYAKHFKYKNGSRSEPELGSAQEWLDEATSSIRNNSWVDPHTSKMTVGEWLDKWIAGYASNKSQTVVQAKVHIKVIREKFGTRQLRTIRPSDVKEWMSELTEKYSISYTYALHARLSQVLSDAVHDGILARNPCSRRTSPPAGTQRPYVATTAQVWALHEALKPAYRNMLLLGAFAGLRIAECAALEHDDIDWENGVVTVSKQHAKDDLKSDRSGDPVPVPLVLLELIKQHAGDVRVIPGVFGRGVGPYQMNREWIDAREKVKGLPEGFRHHDLRH